MTKTRVEGEKIQPRSSSLFPNEWCKSTRQAPQSAIRKNALHSARTSIKHQLLPFRVQRTSSDTWIFWSAHGSANDLSNWSRIQLPLGWKLYNRCFKVQDIFHDCGVCVGRPSTVTNGIIIIPRFYSTRLRRSKHSSRTLRIFLGHVTSTVPVIRKDRTGGMKQGRCWYFECLGEESINRIDPPSMTG